MSRFQLDSAIQLNYTLVTTLKMRYKNHDSIMEVTKKFKPQQKYPSTFNFLT